MRATSPLRYGALLLLTALLAASCSAGGTGDDGTGGGAATSGSPSPSRTAGSPSPAGTPSETPATTSSPRALKAADGTDVAACREGDCEIHIDGPTHVPLAPRFGIADFQVTYTSPDEVAFVVARTEMNTVHCYIRGTGFLALANGVKITIEDIDDTGAVLRFEPKTVDPDNDKAGGSDGLRLFSE